MGTPARLSQNANAVFGPVATITTAPVAIGSSLSGSHPIVRPVPDGMRVQGRDFMLQLAAVNNTQTNWVLVGGCPLVPHAFVASILRGYASMYAEFICHGFTFHFITSAPTTAVGDIMFYINKDRGQALLDTSNNNFMSIVLSDPNTVLGPLWKNNSATYQPTFKTFPTAILDDDDLRTQGPGELFVYSKTSASSTLGSPGYVVVDFDVTFKTLQTNPRDLLFPISRLKYAQYGMGYATNVAIAQGVEAVWRTNTALLDGTFSIISNDAAARLGDVYKIVMCPQYGAYAGGVTPANLLQSSVRVGTEVTTTAIPFTIDDGFTCFGVYVAVANGVLMLYPTFQAAITQETPLQFGTTQAVTQWDIPSWLSLVGNTSGALYQSNF